MFEEDSITASINRDNMKETKQVIVVRSDLCMGKGKIAAQVAHASLSALKKANKMMVKRWENQGQKKVILKVKNEEEMLRLKKQCDKLKIANSLVIDAGLTQIKSRTVTALGIGPDLAERIDKVTSLLPLL